MRLACPNCLQRDKGFRLFASQADVSNDGVSVSRVLPQVGYLCLAEGCKFFAPTSAFEVLEETGEPVGQMPDDPF